ncbi:MAG: autotransporter-associated beta strand repeat-containing protein, partial [Candidatus Omnitrophica bacterium]|nr:autotransporter-associated beta strand repeat-containing protein [Candidatus Omnitrophota bacterium]
NWSTGANWDTGVAPTSTDAVTFDGTSHGVGGASPNKNATINQNFTIASLTINGYTGTITQSANLSVTGNFAQSSGTFTVDAGFTGANETFSVGGQFNFTGGTFNRFTGSGTSGSPYLIYDVYGLQGMGSTTYLSKYFQLANNITATVTEPTGSGGNNWNSGAGFIPVGKTSGSDFTGNFNGEGYTISNLYINDTTDSYVGLFGYAGAASSISNVGLTGGSVTGTGNTYVGGLVGESLGSISIDYNTGTATLNGTNSTDAGVGDLVGYIKGGTIGYSYATGIVNGGTNDNVGGLVGIADSGATIHYSYETGSVTSGGGSGGSWVGGLVGDLGDNGGAATITNSYATGHVIGVNAADDVGGFIGGIETYATTVTVTDNYAAGAITGTGTLGGFVGYDGRGATYSYNYWDTTTSGQPNAIGSSGGSIAGQIIGETTASMHTQSTFSGWDFTTTPIWFMPGPNTYPQLAIQTYYVWKASSAGNWSTPGNWEVNGATATAAPTSADTVVFDSMSTQNATVDTSFGGTVAAVIIDSNYTGTITQSKALTVTGNLQENAGTLTLSYANTIGSVTLNGGTLNINAAGALGSGTFTIAGGTIDNTSGGSITVSTNNAMSWNGNFTFTGTNSLNLGTGAVTLGASRTITASANTLTIGGAISGATYNITEAGSGALVLNGVVGTTTGAVTINAGTLTLAGANTYSGGTTLNSGATLYVNNATALGTGTFTINGGTINSSGITLSTNNPVALNASFTWDSADDQALNLGTGTVTLGASVTITIGSSSYNDALTFGGNVTGAHSLTITGGTSGSNGVVINGVIDTTVTGITVSGYRLTLAGANTYTSGTTLTAGVLNINNAAALGTGALTISGGTIDNTSGGSITLSNNNAMNWNGSFTFTGTNALNIGTGNVTLGGSETVTVTAGTLTMGGTISGNGDIVTLGASSGGTLVLSGNNSFSGGLTIAGGTLSIPTINNKNGNGPLGHNSSVTLDGTLEYTGSTASSSMPFVITAGDTGTVQVDTSGQTLTLSGVISDSASSGNLIKAGAGTLLLSGTNTYHGTTTINAGTLSISADSGLGTAPGSATTGDLVINGGTLAVTASFTLNANRGISLGASNGTVDVASGTTLTYGGIIAGSGGVAKTDSGTLTLSGADTYSGTTTASAGTLNVNNANALGTGSVVINGGTLVAQTSFNVGGSWTVSSGTFTPGTNTVSFTSTSTGQTITTGGQSFYNLTFSGAGGGWTLQDTLGVSQDLTQSNGTVNAGSHTINITRDFVQTSGSFSQTSFSMTVGRNFTANGQNDSTISQQFNGLSLTMSGTGSLTYNNLSSPWQNGFNNLTVGQSGNTVTLPNEVAVNTGLTIGSGTLTGVGALSIWSSATSVTFNASTTLSLADMDIYANITLPALANGYCPILLGLSNTVTQGANIVINGNLEIEGDGYGSRSPVWNTNGYSLTVNGDLDVGSSSNGGSGGTQEFIANGSTITVTGNVIEDLSTAVINLGSSSISVGSNWDVIAGSVTA